MTTLDIHQPCEALFVQEFWLDGRRESQANVVYVLLGSMWRQLSLNDENHEWELKQDDGPPEQIESFDGYEYPLIDVGSKYGCLGKIVQTFSENGYPDRAEAVLLFDDGSRLVCDYFYKDDSDRIRYESA